MSNSLNESKINRVCHVIKRDDFDGYGFNLHAEKGKPGQYIGKVDDDSPAELAGLKQGDRIIEVNGVNIGNETHKQVVQRIKAIACEVRLLVVDPTVVSVSNNNQILDTSNATEIDEISPNNDSGLPNDTNAVLNGASNGQKQNNIVTSVPSNDTNSTDIMTKSNDENDFARSNASSPASKLNSSQVNTKSSSIVATTPTTTTSPEKLNHHKSGTGGGEGLNLKMTVAELRAKLAAKKKYDPKTDTVDLRKKYDIVQKL